MEPGSSLLKWTQFFLSRNRPSDGARLIGFRGFFGQRHDVWLVRAAPLAASDGDSSGDVPLLGEMSRSSSHSVVLRGVAAVRVLAWRGRIRAGGGRQGRHVRPVRIHGPSPWLLALPSSPLGPHRHRPSPPLDPLPGSAPYFQTLFHLPEKAPLRSPLNRDLCN